MSKHSPVHQLNRHLNPQHYSIHGEFGSSGPVKGQKFSPMSDQIDSQRQLERPDWPKSIVTDYSSARVCTNMREFTYVHHIFCFLVMLHANDVIYVIIPSDLNFLPNLQQCIHWSFEWISNLLPYLLTCDYLSMLWLTKRYSVLVKGAKVVRGREVMSSSWQQRPESRSTAYNLCLLLEKFTLLHTL